MNPHDYNRKRWQIHKSRKKLYVITRYNKKRRKALNNKSKQYVKRIKTKENNRDKFSVVAPKKFSIIYSYDETIAFFNSILDILKNNNRRLDIFFDISKVEFITNDAIMYTLALIKNLKSRKGFNYRFSGNSPRNEKANEIFRQSGFYKYVSSSRISITPNENKIMICTDEKVNPRTAGSICKFVSDKLNIDRSDSAKLYEILIELMSNTFNHAYNNNDSLFDKVWYVYAEYHDDKVKCIFLDTGLGIAKTVYKKFREHLISFFSDRDTDCDYVYSAFTGETLRTRTKLPYRGNGLPHILSQCQDGLLKEFSVYSGHANGTYVDKNLQFEYKKSKFVGTLYYWEIRDKENV